MHGDLTLKEGINDKENIEISSGLFFHEQTVNAVNEAINYFEIIENKFDSNWIRNHAKKFRETNFIQNFKEKVVKTFIHGYLHLLGFDHIKDQDYRRMISEEEKIYKSVISKIN